MAGPRAPDAASPSPIRVSDAVLLDLRARLERVRFPQAPTPGWEFGADVETLRELVAFWLDGFEWRRKERRLEDRLPSHTARVRGLDLHFARLAGRGPRPFPLLLLHGWPGSWFEMIEVAGPLADPAAHGGDAADAFDLVIPSLPGHGFSAAPGDPLFGADDAADVLRDLMVDVLGHARFGAQGGDRGAFVAAGLAHRHPEAVAAIHLNLATGIPAPPGERPPEEERWLAAQARWQQEEGGYSAIQSTRPQTLAFGLADSPVGLLAWIVEKWRAWSDCEGDVIRRFGREALLTNAMIYWASGCIRSSVQWYAAHRRRPPAAVRPVRIEVPTGVADFPKEVVRPPRSAVERKYRLVHWSEMARGGHFAAMEEPRALVEDVRRFFRAWR
jgi:pimeloyl-ACP methyl ester carboxylesterase